jgi:hypothetical protein
VLMPFVSFIPAPFAFARQRRAIGNFRVWAIS